MTEAVEDLPVWLAIADEEFERGYTLPAEQVPRMYALFRHPALVGDDVVGPSGPVAWGMWLPGGDLVTVRLSGAGGAGGVMYGDSVEKLERRWGVRLDAELRWLPRPANTTLRGEPPA